MDSNKRNKIIWESVAMLKITEPDSYKVIVDFKGAIDEMTYEEYLDSGILVVGSLRPYIIKNLGLES